MTTTHDIDLKSLPQMSASQISVAKTCLRKYYYLYVLYEQTDKNMYGATGTAAHAAIEHLLKTGEKDLEPTIRKKVASIVSEWDSKQKTIAFRNKQDKATADVVQMLDPDGVAQLEAFLQDQTVVAIEQYFELPFPSKNPICRMTGYIDLTTKEWVVDWKTSQKNPTKADLTHDSQFIIYYWAFRHLYGYAPTKMFRYKLPDHYAAEFDTTNIRVKFTALLQDVQYVLTAKKHMKDNIPLRKNLDSTCRQCPFFEQCYDEPMFKVH